MLAQVVASQASGFRRGTRSDPWVAKMNLAELYRRQGKYDPSPSPLFLQAFAARRRALGEEHPATLTAETGLAVVYRWEGRFAEAEPLNIKAVVGSCRVLGEEHRETLLRITSLGILYEEEAKYSEAEPLLTKVLPVDRRVLGAAHSITRLCETSIGPVAARATQLY